MVEVSSSKKSRASRRGIIPLMHAMQFGLVAIISFYIGTLFGFRYASDLHHATATAPSARSLKKDSTEGAVNKEECVRERVDLKRQVAEMKKQAALATSLSAIKEMRPEKREPAESSGESSCTSTSDAFKGNKRNFSAGAGGLSRVNRREFMETHDYGWPLPESDHTEALILHQKHASPEPTDGAGKDGPSGIPYYSKVEDATANCGEMLVVPMDKGGDQNKCFVLLSGFPSYHVARFVRGQGDTTIRKLDKVEKLRHIGRGVKGKVVNFAPPKKSQIEKNWFALSRYIAAKDVAHSRLKKILKSVAKDNTVIVMVCNIGQAVLLANFVCHGRRHGFPLDNVLLFSTDMKTHRLATSLGITSYFDEENFGHLPEKEAEAYGDPIFTQMMFAKVLTVQMVNYLGYDLLFQDVDMVWYKNPLELFHKETGPLAEYDMLFQDDGAKSQRYAPYCANSGFYYVRYNPRTVYLFTSLMYHSDMITGSHQAVLIQIMADHASLFGLRVKVLDDKEFPSGYHYHRNKDLMKNIMTGKSVPYVYHMSWTKNKTDKLKYLKQMGLWHVEEKCEDAKGLEVIEELEGDPDKDAVFNACCSVDPLITCFYKDKPSKIPCKDSPSIDKGRGSWW
eukprot:CAMPEP_0194333788 /NCGR_PEP_ID=MMETSP0171-20130528/63946_1 /TAXON_ID=218684 /ORGANISM="Corethron pennatum, Strain L29A3" /LENGTH=621 /DNA_ID=CAMNT_0039096165 /DNA_START=31 /DNA_END=1896 /DNA_ORIENTATION=-